MKSINLTVNSYYDDETVLYLNGEFIKASEANINLYSQSLHYGISVFEGIRSYKTIALKTKIFKAEEHFLRLKKSAESMHMPFPWDVSVIEKATYELLKRNNLQDAYIRPIVFSPPNMSFKINKESYLAIQCWKMSPFLGNKLLRVMTSNFERPNPKAFIMEAKVSGHYVNSLLASVEAQKNGFDEALLLDRDGLISEGPGANVFCEKNGILYTPALGNILPGITRSTLIDMCLENNISIVEKKLTLQELKSADAAFFCGTAAEIVGWKSIDDYEFPLEWSSSKSKWLQDQYAQLVMENYSLKKAGEI